MVRVYCRPGPPGPLDPPGTHTLDGIFPDNCIARHCLTRSPVNSPSPSPNLQEAAVQVTPRPNSRVSLPSSSSSSSATSQVTSPAPSRPATELKGSLHLGMCKSCKRIYRRTESLHSLDSDRETKRISRPRDGRRTRDTGKSRPKSFASEGQMRRRDKKLQEQLEFLSQALVRLEGSLKESNSPSLPALTTSNRKTWDVPKKDPYYAVLMDPFKRSHSVEPKSEGYEPSFGSALRGKEHPGHHRETYLKDLDEQPACQRPDPAEERKRYEQELKEQIEAKKVAYEEARRKEKEDEEKLERRLREQQERMRVEYEEDDRKRRIKEEEKRRQQEENALREAEIKREMEEKRRKIEEEKRQVEMEREAEQKLREEEARKRKEVEEEERRQREEVEQEKRKNKQVPEWKRRMLERQKREKDGEKSQASKKQGRVSKTSKGKVGGGEDSEAVAEVAEKLGSLRRGLEKKQGQLKEEAKKGPAGKTQKKS